MFSSTLTNHAYCLLDQELVHCQFYLLMLVQHFQVLRCPIIWQCTYSYTSYSLQHMTDLEQGMPKLERLKFNPLKQVPDLEAYLVCRVLRTLSQYALAADRSDFPVSIITLVKLANTIDAPNLRSSAISCRALFRTKVKDIAVCLKCNDIVLIPGKLVIFLYWLNNNLDVSWKRM